MGDIGDVNDVLKRSELKNIDVVLCPINGFYTISSEELVKIINIIKPRLTIPMHYYRKENDSGLPDDHQIDTFKRLVEYQETNNSSVIVNDELFAKPVLIFNKSEGDK